MLFRYISRNIFYFCLFLFIFILILLLNYYITNEYYNLLGYTTETDLLLEMKQLCGHGAKTSVLDLFESGLISMIGRPIR